MRLYSNNLDAPFTLKICLNRDRELPWSVKRSVAGTVRFSSAGKLITFLKSEGLLTMDICKAICRNARTPLSWMDLHEKENALSTLLYGCSILYSEPWESPFFDGILIYVLDRYQNAHIIEVSSNYSTSGNIDDLSGTLLCVRMSDALK